MAYPVDKKKHPITCVYGLKGKRWSSGHHQGIDFALPMGTEITAVTDGTVINISGGWGPAFGHAVIIEHLVNKKKYYVLYGHLMRSQVVAGVKVEKGQVIGYSGSSGNVSGPHLHLEVREKNAWAKTGDIDPKFILEV